MWKYEYITAVKRALRDQYHFTQIGGTCLNPALRTYDGTYDCVVFGQHYQITIKDWMISCPELEDQNESKDKINC